MKLLVRKNLSWKSVVFGGCSNVVKLWDKKWTLKKWFQKIIKSAHSKDDYQWKHKLFKRSWLQVKSAAPDWSIRSCFGNQLFVSSLFSPFSRQVCCEMCGMALWDLKCVSRKWKRARGGCNFVVIHAVNGSIVARENQLRGKVREEREQRQRHWWIVEWSSFLRLIFLFVWLNLCLNRQTCNESELWA